jgi:hypothetical protein
MKILQALALILSLSLLPVMAQADTSGDGWAKVDFGKDEARIPLQPGFASKLSNENMEGGIYYATFFKNKEDFSNWTNMLVVAVYSGIPPQPEAPPPRIVLDYQMKEARGNCPPENFAAAVDPEDLGYFGQMTSCKFKQEGKVTLVYEYTIAMLGTDQVFSITRMGRLDGKDSSVKPPADIIAAWKAEMKHSLICPRTGGTCPAAGKDAPGRNMAQ